MAKRVQTLGSIQKGYRRTKLGSISGPFYFWVWRENGKQYKRYIWAPGTASHMMVQRAIARFNQKREEKGPISEKSRSRKIQALLNRLWYLQDENFSHKREILKRWHSGSRGGECYPKTTKETSID